MRLAAPLREARCDTAGCGGALLFRHSWQAGQGQVVVQVYCRRCKQLKTISVQSE